MSKIRFLTEFVNSLFKKSIVTKISGAMFAQGILSLTNLLVSFVIARFATKGDYGTYVILISIVMILGNFQAALVGTPLKVLAPQKAPSDRRLFISGLGFGQWFIFMPLFITVLAGIFVYSRIQENIPILDQSILVILVSVAFLLRAFVRTVNYSDLRINLLVKMDLFFILAISLGIGALIIQEMVTFTSAMLVLGFGYISACIYGYFGAKSKYTYHWESIKKSLNETWRYGRWALVGVTSDIFKNRGYIYIVSLSIGIEALAEISAARLFMSGIGLFVSSSGNIIVAMGADILNRKGLKQFKKFFILITCLIVSFFFLYILGIYLFHPILISLLGTRYAGIDKFLVIWSLFFLFFSLRYPITNALVVLKDFKALAKYDVISAVLTTSACLLLTSNYQGGGAIISLTIGEAGTLLFAGARLIKSINKNIYLLN